MPPRPLPPLLRVAHRGASRECPENTLPAFARALARAADAIELDVHATRDGVVVVHHDATATVGGVRRPIASTRAAEMPRLPTLAAVCTLVAGRAELLVEVKGEHAEAATLDTLARYPGAYALHSFDHDAIARVARLAPHVRRGLLFEQHLDAATLTARVTSTGAHDLWPQADLVEARLMATARALGMRVIAWTVNTPGLATHLRALGVAGICTDDCRWIP